jgi:glutamyl-tRNA synthetase
MKTNLQNSLITLEKFLPRVESLDPWTFENIEKCCMDLVSDMQVKNGVVLWPVRTALSGKKSTPGGAFEIADIIGKEESIKRVKIGIEKLKKANQ